ncbi:MAG: hypothetical protein JNL70_11535 [Saprospiraceae bacterium]|nr:hypothetical protein [Saprospiraceae bacterium]
MIELKLRLPSLRVLDKLLPLLQELHIPYQTRAIEPTQKDASKKAAIIAKIQSGAMNLPDFDQALLSFEESRQDGDLDSRD